MQQQQNKNACGPNYVVIEKILISEKIRIDQGKNSCRVTIKMYLRNPCLNRNFESPSRENMEGGKLNPY